MKNSKEKSLFILIAEDDETSQLCLRLMIKNISDKIMNVQTAYALYGDKEKAIAAGCDDYISKSCVYLQTKQFQYFEL